jgi:hypothetical protein
VWDIDKGMLGNYIIEIKSDKHNGLWLGISEKGVYHIDTKKASLVDAILSDVVFQTK